MGLQCDQSGALQSCHFFLAVWPFQGCRVAGAETKANTETHSLFTFKVKVVPYYKNQKGTTTTLKVNVLFPVCITLSPSSMQTTGDFDNLLATTSQQHFWSSTLFLTSSTQGQPPITHQGLDTFFPNNQRLPAGHLGLCNWGLTWDITRENPHRHRKNIKNCTQKGIH